MVKMVKLINGKEVVSHHFLMVVDFMFKYVVRKKKKKEIV